MKIKVWNQKHNNNQLKLIEIMKNNNIKIN